MNQMTECWRVRDLAQMVAGLTGAEVARLPNPRQEADENELLVENRRLLSYGLEPITLEDGLLLEVAEIARRYAERADLSKIPCVSCWNAERAAATLAAVEATVAAE
jgi:UDP-sulfoquinovose synthase